MFDWDILKSRTIWMCIVLVLINGVPSIKAYLPGDWLPTIDTLLALLAAYFRITPKQSLQGFRSFEK